VPTILVVRQYPGLAGGLAAVPAFSEDLIVALTNGTVWVIPGGGRPVSRRWWSRAALRCRRLIGCAGPVASMRLGAGTAFAEVPKPPTDELLALSSKVVLIERSRSAPLGFRAALEQTVRKWPPVRIADV